MSRSLQHQPEQPEPPPRVVARRVVALPLRRRLDVTIVEDHEGRADVWMRCYTDRGVVVGQLHAKPSALRPIAGALSELAGELGITP
jgi:hypothetical protein